MHALEDAALTNVFHHVWRRKNNASSHDSTGIPVCIPHTIVYEHNFPRGWYFTTSRTGIQRRIGKDIDTKGLHEALLDPEASGLPKSKCDIVATYVQRKFDEIDGKDYFAVEHLNKEMLHNFEQQNRGKGDQSISNKNGVLQRYVTPRGDHEEVIQVVWSPHSCCVEKRQNVNNLYDKRISVAERCVTYHGPPNLTTESRVAPRLLAEVHRAVEVIISHIEYTEHRSMEHAVLYFKSDENAQLWFLWCPLVRFRPILERNLPPRPSSVLPLFHTPRDIHQLRELRKGLASAQEGRALAFIEPKIKIESLIPRIGSASPLPYQSKLKPSLFWRDPNAVEGRVQTRTKPPKIEKTSKVSSRKSDSFYSSSFIETNVGSFCRKSGAASFRKNSGSPRARRMKPQAEVIPRIRYSDDEFKSDPTMDVNAAVFKTIHQDSDPRISDFPELAVLLRENIDSVERVVDWCDNLSYFMYTHFLRGMRPLRIGINCTPVLSPSVEDALNDFLASVFLPYSDDYYEDFSYLSEVEYDPEDSKRSFIVRSQLKWKAQLPKFKLATLRNCYSDVVYFILKKIKTNALFVTPKPEGLSVVHGSISFESLTPTAQMSPRTPGDKDFFDPEFGAVVDILV